MDSNDSNNYSFTYWKDDLCCQSAVDDLNNIIEKLSAVYQTVCGIEK